MATVLDLQSTLRAAAIPQAAIARRCGLTQGAISHQLVGRRRLSPEVRAAIIGAVRDKITGLETILAHVQGNDEAPALARGGLGTTKGLSTPNGTLQP